MFQPVPSDVRFPQLEEAVLAFWEEQQVYEKSLQRRHDAPRFVFYEGPPTANGLPHPGHCLTRAIKDLFPRYKTMRGYRCERKGGWDTHGLPVEVEVCKELGIHSKEEIESFGIEPFIHKCQQSVWRYMQQWERLTQRLGFWIHLDDAYVTYHQSYVESVWWSLKTLFDRGLLYQGHKIVWWWAQGGTALSSGEVGQGYRQVADPSVYVRFPLIEQPDVALLVWTTTPWTLPSNQFAAVDPQLDYARVADPESDQDLILARDLVPVVAAKVQRELSIVETFPGAKLVGQRYQPPFDCYYQSQGTQQGQLIDGGSEFLGWRVLPANFVTTESGTGIVHQAPAFGEVDYEVLQTDRARFCDGEGPQLICAVGPDGKFTAALPEYAGQWVKDADKPITRELRERGLLFHQEQYSHDYPFCWRAEDDPLIQYPRESWFIRTTQFKDRMLANNGNIRWMPEHIRDGRFGNFLESNVDWALSRERYWGTPLPIWVCSETGRMEAIGSYGELLGKPGIGGTEVWEQAQQEHPQLPEDLKIHKPYIDAVYYDSPYAAGAKMYRVPEVIDCWYDSGAMPFAQWGYPYQGQDAFAQQFPADFISEAIDQTRGWFYSLLAISTLLFDKAADKPDETPAPELPHPYRNCVVLGLMLGEDGTKMSKSKRNYREPGEILDRYGADALRWYFFANQTPWSSIRYREQAIKDSIPEFLLRLWNVYSFFVIYANIDGFDPTVALSGKDSWSGEGQLTHEDLLTAKEIRPPEARGELDRWILSELNQTISTVTQAMDNYDNYSACQQLTRFVDALSNWYVRRSRDRFWQDDLNSPGKQDAYWTLYECLLTTSKLIAPFVPFLAETLWKNLSAGFGDQVLESVHLCDFPTSIEASIDHELSQRMRLLREIASLGRKARMESRLKVRQPLAKVEVILAAADHQSWLETHDDLLREELNVKELAYAEQADEYIRYQIQPNFQRLGPRIGKLMPHLKQRLLDCDGRALLAELKDHGQIAIDVGEESLLLDEEDLQFRLQAKEGWAAAQGDSCVVVLATELTPQLVREGLARDLVRLVQDRRKQLDCAFTDRIEIGIETAAPELLAAISENHDFIVGETLSRQLVTEALDAVEGSEHEIAGEVVRCYVRVVTAG